MTTILEGALALAALLGDAPEWFPEATGWEITVPTESNPQHVLGAMPDRIPSIQRREMRALAETIGGTYEVTRSRPDAPNELVYVHFWYAGVHFSLWALVSVRMAVPA